MNERIAAVIVAAGQATRFGVPKVLTPIAGIPAIVRILRTFTSVSGWSSIVVVASAENRAEIAALLTQNGLQTHVVVVLGGARRQDSVMAGVEAAGDADIIVIHDGARPLVTPNLIRASISAVIDGADAAVIAIPVSDTLKRQTGSTVETVDRANLWRAQTPQAFRASALRAGFAEATRRVLVVTDEASLIETIGGRVTLLPGDEQNIKLTTPDDLRQAEAYVLASSRNLSRTRTGIGYDVHRLVPDRKLFLGGIEIPFDRGLDGHSDADVLLHAIADAILGACALGDIGQHFPPTDESYRDISSLTLLDHVRHLVNDRGATIVNIDATLIAEAPRIGPYSAQMRGAIADTLQLADDAISIKATTNEGLGFAGRQEGIAALAIATVLMPE